jgi:hypothetical protein
METELTGWSRPTVPVLGLRSGGFAPSATASGNNPIFGGQGPATVPAAVSQIFLFFRPGGSHACAGPLPLLPGPLRYVWF